MPATRGERTSMLSSMSATRRERTLIGKTSLLRIVPMACGQAANKGAAHEWHQDDAVTRDARSLRTVVTLHHDRLSERSYLFTMSDSASARALRSNGCTELLRERAKPDWWSQTGSNRRPPACKAGALPAELWPRKSVTLLAGLPAEAAERRRLVGLGRFELPTSRLSSARSNQLSYKPVILSTGRAGAQSLRATTCGPRLVHEERET